MNHLIGVAGIGLDRSIYIRAVSVDRDPVVGPPPGAPKPSQEWTSLGGVFIQPPTMASWGPGRLDVFGVGQDGAVYHKYWGNGWSPASGWNRLGGVFTSPPVVVAPKPDRLEVFGLGQNLELWRKRWNGTRWLPAGTDWESLGGGWSSLPAVRGTPSDLTIAGVGIDTGMYYDWRDPQNQWHYGDWYALGGQFTSAPVILTIPGIKNVLALGRNDEIWRRHLVGGIDPSQIPWESMGGKFISAPAAGRLERHPNDGVVFGLGQDAAMWHCTYTVQTPETRPEAWSSLGGAFTSAPTVVETRGDRLDVFGLGEGLGVWHKAWVKDHWEPTGDGWRALGGKFRYSTPLPTNGRGGGDGGGGAGVLRLTLDDQSPDFDVTSATWRVWRQQGGSSAQLVHSSNGGTASISGLVSGGQYLVRADVAAANRATGQVEAAEFRGFGAPVDGAPTHVLAWGGAPQSHRWSLRSEQRNVDGLNRLAAVILYG